MPPPGSFVSGSLCVAKEGEICTGLQGCHKLSWTPGTTMVKTLEMANSPIVLYLVGKGK